jgi:hypothetical protein
MDGIRVADRAGKSARDTGPSTALSHAAQTESLAPHAPPCGQTGLTHVFPGACGATRSAPPSPRRGCARKRMMPDVGERPRRLQPGLIACPDVHKLSLIHRYAGLSFTCAICVPISRPNLVGSGTLHYARFPLALSAAPAYALHTHERPDRGQKPCKATDVSCRGSTQRHE